MDRLRLAVGWLVAGAWAASAVISTVHPTYDPPQGLSALMGIVVGALFAPSVLGKMGKRRED